MSDDARGPLTINIVTIFPNFFREPLATSIPARAGQAGLVRYRIVDLRDFTHDRHRTVDDTPYGGGAGMVMKPEPFFEALDSIGPAGPVVLLSARGKVFEHADAVRYSVQTRIDAPVRPLQGRGSEGGGPSGHRGGLPRTLRAFRR